MSFDINVSFLEKILFAKNLALMIKAGQSLRESLVTIQEQSKSKKFKRVLEEILKNIDNGQPLAASLARHPRVFDSFYINMVKVGEESGTLEKNLDYLALQLEKSYELRGKVKAAMLYPVIILTAVIVLSLTLTFFVLPKIIPIFKTFRIQLPLTTRILIRITEIGQNYGLFILSGIAVLIIALIFLSRLRPVKFFIHKLTLKFPLLAVIFLNVNLAYFNRTLGILLKSGLPVVNALDITRATLGNLVYQKELEKITEEVKRGKSIADYLIKKENVFPLMVSRMIGVAEKTGNLEETLLYLGDFYEAEVDKATKNVSSVLEPILLLIVGAAVGFIALAIISPIYEITRGLHI